MCRSGLEGVRRGKRVKTTISDRKASCPLDRVNRQFTADRPNRQFIADRLNRLWVSDFTDGPSWAGMVYVAFVIDVFARRIVGWRGSRTASAETRERRLPPAKPMRSRTGSGNLRPCPR